MSEPAERWDRLLRIWYSALDGLGTRLDLDPINRSENGRAWLVAPLAPVRRPPNVIQQLDPHQPFHHRSHTTPHLFPELDRAWFLTPVIPREHAAVATTLTSHWSAGVAEVHFFR